MNSIRKFMAIGSVVAAAALALVGAPAAQAEAAPWCTGSDLLISTYDVHPKGGGIKRHAIAFVAREGTSCRIGGTPTNVRFYDNRGVDLNIPLTTGHGDHVEVTVNGGWFGPVAYVSSWEKGSGVRPSFVEFDLPGENGSRGDRIVTGWPSSLGVGVQINNIGWPAS
ncbi:hypothetical protein [Lentzea sp. E54]|uniref:hypothetical protein n=1 Tax=Lentzea xerophila TaxID=3435883 RepID=UPI003DA4A506